MKRSPYGVWSFAVLLLAVSGAWGQENPLPQQPVPGFGTENPAPPVTENPPISGLDLPNLEPHGAPLSYLQPGAHVSESIDSNIQNALGGSTTQSITRGLGSLELQRLWSNYALALDYLGGVAYYNVTGLGFKQIEEFGANQKITWKRGQLGVRDAFSYQPEGTFGSAYGSVGTTGAGLNGLSYFGGQGLGELGQVPRIMNISLVDAVQNLTPRSSITAAAGYGFVHFLGDDSATGSSFIGSSQITAQVGYDRVLGPHDQAALQYAYQGFDFSTGVAFHSHVIQLLWGHRISGRMDFLISAGPQITLINDLPTVVNSAPPPSLLPQCIPEATQTGFALVCPENDLRISAAGRASLRYRFKTASLDLSYDHYITSGSGFFAGAESDIARLDVLKPLGRVWTAFSDIGYSRNSRVSSLSAQELSTCSSPTSGSSSTLPPCPGTSANVYSYGFIGGGVHRNIGREFTVFASYQFNYLTFDSNFCSATTPGPCNRTSQRNVGTIGLDWTPRPIRID